MVLNLTLSALMTGGSMRSFVLHQVRDQILTDPELTFGANTSRDNISSNLCNEVNGQNLPDLNLARNDMNIEYC